MRAQNVLDTLTKYGAAVSVKNNQLVIKARSELPQPLLEAVRNHKPELIACLRRQADSTWRLYPFLGRQVKTQSNITGKLLQVFHDRVTLYPAGAPRVVYCRPEEVIADG